VAEAEACGVAGAGGRVREDDVNELLLEPAEDVRLLDHLTEAIGEGCFGNVGVIHSVHA
jgi:hypothetical protein